MRPFNRQCKRPGVRPRLEQLECRVTPSVYGDFNGDGYGDLAVGVPGANDNGQDDVGAVHVIYGSSTGLRAVGAQIFLLGVPGLVGSSSAGDRFGDSLAVGDFNGDGFADLAVGVPGRDYGEAYDVGIVKVLFGSGGGLTEAGSQTLVQGPSGIGGTPESVDLFGKELATGNFNGDIWDDLAIGVPGDSAVHVLYGSATGFSLTGDSQQWTPTSLGLPDPGRFHSLSWGYVLASGDFNGNGADELVIGLPTYSSATGTAVGGVLVLPGAASGLTATGSTFWSQNSYGIADVEEPFDYFGAALATGDFNGDRRADLAVSAHGETINDSTAGGAVHVIYGSPQGLTPVGNQLWTNPDGGVQGFGWALAAGDFNGDRRDDLAIGSPYKGSNGSDFGSVFVYYGQASGLSAFRRQRLLQGSVGAGFLILAVGDAIEYQDHFGETLASGDFNGDGRADLVIGVPDEDVGDGIDNGLIHVVYGHGFRLSTTKVQTWTQYDLGIFGDDGDGFGGSLGTGRGNRR